MTQPRMNHSSFRWSTTQVGDELLRAEVLGVLVLGPKGHELTPGETGWDRPDKP